MRSPIPLACIAALLNACAEAPPPPPPRAPDPPTPRPPSFVAFGDGDNSAEATDVAVLPNGDLVVVGCQYGPLDLRDGARAAEEEAVQTEGSSARAVDFMQHGAWIARLDHTTLQTVWADRKPAPCGIGDNHALPRVTVAADGRIWMMGPGWGREYEEPSRPVLVGFDASGNTTGEPHALAPGERILSLVALPGRRLAMLGWVEHAPELTFVAVVEETGRELWRQQEFGPTVALDSLAVRGEILVGGRGDGPLELTPEMAQLDGSIGFVLGLRAGDGSTAAAWVRHHRGIVFGAVHVATSGDDAVIVEDLGVRVDARWPDTLPAWPRAGEIREAVLVESLDGGPRWRRLIPASHTIFHVGGIALMRDQLAIAMDVQQGTLDLGAGAWRSAFFNLGAFVELSPDGDLRDRARITAEPGDHTRVFPGPVVWDGTGFSVVGEARGEITAPIAYRAGSGAAFVWRP